MHPARIPAEYWRHRIQMAKAMGLNTIAAYVFWNYHEESDGQFVFATGNRDMARFIRVAQDERMWVLLRPGPYVCAEWEFGGLLPYLLADPNRRIRSMYPRYMAAADRCMARLANEQWLHRTASRSAGCHWSVRLPLARTPDTPRGTTP